MYNISQQLPNLTYPFPTTSPIISYQHVMVPFPYHH
jgi:hypothetical protein